MSPDQVQKLTNIEEELTDLFIEEARPADWPGMASKEARGDRYWHKKNALATLTIVGRIQTVLRDIRTGAGPAQAPDDAPDDDDDSIEKEAKALEAQGVAILKKHRAKGR